MVKTKSDNSERLAEAIERELDLATPDEEIQRTNEEEEEFSGEAVEKEDDSIFGEWKQTHWVGECPVMEVRSGNFKHFIKQDGTKTRPTVRNPLRKVEGPLHLATKTLWLPREIFALASSVMVEHKDFAEDVYGNTARKLDDETVRLSLLDRLTGLQQHIIFQLPDKIEVVGAEVTY